MSSYINSIPEYTAANNRIFEQYRNNLMRAKSDNEAFIFGLKIAGFYINNNTREALRYQKQCYDLALRMYDKALEATRVNSDADQKALHDLWDKFDEIFFKIFPDFTEQFNTLLRPDEQVSLRTPGRLNTDLRIYALVRLGINNSVHISQILGLSPQTVYNARQKMRARAVAGTADFAECVRNLGAVETPDNVE